MNTNPKEEPVTQEQLEKNLISLDREDSLLSLEAVEEELCRPESDKLYSQGGAITDSFGNQLIRIGEQV